MLKPKADAGFSPYGFRFSDQRIPMAFVFGQRFLLALLLRVLSSSATVSAGFTP